MNIPWNIYREFRSFTSKRLGPQERVMSKIKEFTQECSFACFSVIVPAFALWLDGIVSMQNAKSAKTVEPVEKAAFGD